MPHCSVIFENAKGLKNINNERIFKVASKSLSYLAEAISKKNGNSRISFLDVGCGFGSESYLAASLGCDVQGIDLSELRLGRAGERRRYFEKCYGKALNVEFDIRNAVETGFESDSFDLVYNTQFLTHVFDPESFIRECKRVLKPGGFLLSMDTNKLKPYAWLKTSLERKGPLYTEKYVESLGKSVPYAVERLLSPFELARVCKRNGFDAKAGGYGFVLPLNAGGKILEINERIEDMLAQSPLSVFGGIFIVLAVKL